MITLVVKKKGDSYRRYDAEKYLHRLIIEKKLDFESRGWDTTFDFSIKELAYWIDGPKSEPSLETISSIIKGIYMLKEKGIIKEVDPTINEQIVISPRYKLR